jgi:hypothetical protein
MKNIRECLTLGKIANLQIIPYPSGENLICNPCPGSKEYSYFSFLHKGISATSSPRQTGHRKDSTIFKIVAVQ